LKQKGFSVELFDKNESVGGNIQTRKIDEFLIEYGPNSLIKSPRLVDLIKSLKLESELSTANPANKKRYVLQNGKLKPLPMSILKMATNDFFTIKAKLRLLREPFVKSKSSEKESVAEFFERRFGREIVDKAADPFIAGIFAGKPENLSVKAAFPRLYELERDYGSLLVGSLRAKNEKADENFPRSFSFVNGIQILTDRLAESLNESLKTGTRISGINKTTDGKFSVKTDSLARIFDSVVIATPAEAAANLVENLDSDLSKHLRNIYYPPVALVYFGIKKENIAFNLDGFGFLVPSNEKRKILGTLWNSAVFARRAPEGYHLLTTFVGGSRDAKLFEHSDEELKKIVFEELKQILGLSAEPDFVHIKRWNKAIPQYNIGYETVENGIKYFEQKYSGMFFCSNFYRGISVGDSVKNAFLTADEIENFLRPG
jgi:oxygen-dependent protoporphyrinogen oxidase